MKVPIERKTKEEHSLMFNSKHSTIQMLCYGTDGYGVQDASLSWSLQIVLLSLLCCHLSYGTTCLILKK